MSTDSSLTSLELQPSDANVMVRFVGELNENLKFVEKTFNVKIFQNGNNLKIKGNKKDVDLSVDALRKLYEVAGQGIEINSETLNLCIQESDIKMTNVIKIKTLILKIFQIMKLTLELVLLELEKHTWLLH
jgi:phosphate starvation-inducible protein PhoH